MTLSLHYQRCLLTLTLFHALVYIEKLMFNHYIWLHFLKIEKYFCDEYTQTYIIALSLRYYCCVLTLTYFLAALNIVKFMVTHC